MNKLFQLTLVCAVVLSGTANAKPEFMPLLVPPGGIKSLTERTKALRICDATFPAGSHDRFKCRTYVNTGKISQ